MTNDIKISRELAERLTECWNGTDARIELRALLAAPVAESQEPVESRHTAVKALHDIMQAVPCNSLYSLAEAVLDAGYAAPVVERQEPFAWVVISPNGNEFSELQSSEDYAKDLAHDLDCELPASHVGSKHKIMSVFTCQPAPVAVVLPERNTLNTYNSRDWDEGYTDGWGAYDAELKRLNPSL